MEKPGYRDTLERLRELYPGKENLTMAECEKYFHADRRTLLQDKNFPARKLGRKVYIIPLISLARYLTLGKE